MLGRVLIHAEKAHARTRKRPQSTGNDGDSVLWFNGIDASITVQTEYESIGQTVSANAYASTTRATKRERRHRAHSADPQWRRNARDRQTAVSSANPATPHVPRTMHAVSRRAFLRQVCAPALNSASASHTTQESRRHTSHPCDVVATRSAATRSRSVDPKRRVPHAPVSGVKVSLEA